MTKVYIETYGCALNKSDSMLMASILEKNNYKITKTPEDSEVIVINTCTVRKDTEDRIIKRLKNLGKMYPEKKIIIAGCMAAAQPYTVKKVQPKAVLISTENVYRITEAINNSNKDFLEPSFKKRDLIPYYREGVIATIPLNDGCLGECSFCITVRARRRLISRNPRLLVNTIAKLVKAGVYEIQLSSQDSAVYGVDLYGKQILPELINTILEKVNGNYAIRIGMMTPEWFKNIIDEMINVYRNEKIFKFIHLPLQSGDDEVLKIMKRKYTVDEYREMIKELRRKIPDLYIATDIIVGHPGETEEAFQNTLEIVRELEFERIHVAQYTPRPLTLSARMKQVPDPIKKERSKRLMKLYEEIGYKKNKEYIGKTLNAVVVEFSSKNGSSSFTARPINYNSIVVPYTPSISLGARVKIRIESATFFDLRGKIVN